MNWQSVRRRIGRTASLAFLLALFMAPGAGATTVFATEGDYPPWNETLADGQLAGFDIDLVDALCKSVGRECWVITAPFPGMIQRLADGDFDAIISGIAITPERLALISFTRPYMSLSVSFAVAAGSALAGSAPTSTEATLRLLLDARVGAQTGTVNAELVRTILPRATLVQFDDQSSLNRAVREGRVDAGIAATLTWMHQPAGVKGSIATLGPPFVSAVYPVLGEGLAIGIAHGNHALEESLDTAICHLAEDGTIASLSRKWFGTDLSVSCNLSQD